eukprot:7377645-Prymnesium_polylepis.1
MDVSQMAFDSGRTSFECTTKLSSLSRKAICDTSILSPERWILRRAGRVGRDYVAAGVSATYTSQ